MPSHAAALCRVDIHPAKRGWSSTGRGFSDADTNVEPNAPYHGVTPGHSDNTLLLQFDGYMNATVYTNAFHYVVDTYFTKPHYYCAPTTLSNGTVAQCPYFAMYQLDYFVNGVGGISTATTVLEDFRTYAESQGTCVHFVVMVAGSPKSIASQFSQFKQLKVASATSYNWMKLQLSAASTFPTANFTDMSVQSVAMWGTLAESFSSGLGIKYAPVASVGWDSSPRTLPSDPFGEWGCT